MLAFVYLKIKRNPLRINKLEGVCMTLSVCYMVFYSSTYYMNRYILVVLVLICMALSSYGIRVFEKLHLPKSILVFVVVLIGLLQTNYILPNKFNYDEDLSYLTYVKAQKEALAYIFENDLDSKKIHLNFPLNYVVKDLRFGYIKNKEEELVNQEIENSKNIVIINPLGLINNPKKIPLGLVKEWNVGFVKISHYETWPTIKDSYIVKDVID